MSRVIASPVGFGDEKARKILVNRAAVDDAKKKTRVERLWLIKRRSCSVACRFESRVQIQHVIGAVYQQNQRDIYRP